MVAYHIVLAKHDHMAARGIKVGEMGLVLNRVQLERRMHLDVAVVGLRKSKAYGNKDKPHLRDAFGQDDAGLYLVNGHIIRVFNQLDVQDVLAGLLRVAVKAIQVRVVAVEPRVVPATKEWVAWRDDEHGRVLLVMHARGRDIADIVAIVNVAGVWRELEGQILQDARLAVDHTRQLVLETAKVVLEPKGENDTT